MVSDGLEARLGPYRRSVNGFIPGAPSKGRTWPRRRSAALEVLLKGVFDKERFLDLVRHFVVFEEDRGTVVKKMAGYHQFHATREAVDSR